MRINYTKNFRRNFDKRISRNKKLTQQFRERLQLFLRNPQQPLLKDHKLTGTKKHLRAFSITGDVRVLYYQEEEKIYFVDIGTHNQVY